MKADKRKVHNRKKLYEFLMETDKFGRPRKTAMNLGSEEFLRMAQFYMDYGPQLEHIQAYVRRYRQAAGELALDDVEHVAKLLAVQEVMES